MRRQQLESAVARATGESLRTIQLRGFSLVCPNSGRRSNRGLDRNSSHSIEQSHANDLDDHDLD